MADTSTNKFTKFEFDSDQILRMTSEPIVKGEVAPLDINFKLTGALSATNDVITLVIKP